MSRVETAPLVAGEVEEGPSPVQPPARPSAAVVTAAERDDLRRRHPGVVFDEAEIVLIQARVDYAGLPLWRRITTRAPKGWWR